MVLPLEANLQAAIQCAYCFSCGKGGMRPHSAQNPGVESRDSWPTNSHASQRKVTLIGKLTLSQRSQISFMPSATGIRSFMLNF